MNLDKNRFLYIFLLKNIIIIENCLIISTKGSENTMALIEWYKASCLKDEKPEALDKTSSEYGVYERKNFELVTRKDTVGEEEVEVEMWEYDERYIPLDEYQVAQLTANAVEFRRENDIIDEYTETLIEEGII